MNTLLLQTARTEFTSAFKAYEEAGNTSKTIACLKYLLLAAMLSGSKINPFDSQVSVSGCPDSPNVYDYSVCPLTFSD